MFERICVLLLRIYPAGFRRAYGPEAVQLVRDRARHERGVWRRARLLMDLTVDLCATSLRGWEPAAPVLTRVDGAPRFDIIETGGPRPQALAAGMVASILMFAGFALLFEPKAPPPPTATVLGEGTGAPSPSTGSSPSVPAVASEFDPHHALVAAIAGRLRQHYFDRAMGGRLAATLLATSAAGAYAPLDMATEFAAQINADIDTISRTLGVPAGAFVADVIYSTQPLPTRPPPAMTAEMREQVYASLRQQNCLFERIETLPKNIGYIKLNGFGDARACGEMAGRAMASLNDAELLILDLRDNGGGFGETALQIASYLFDRPTYMYDPRPDSPVPTRTASPVPGNKLADKPLYVLTSSRTQSAAEYFVYNMKMLNRATVVGETTAGRQHSGAFFRIDDHFGVGVQEKAPAGNPYAIKGWERIGIEPDVKVPSGEAFDAARMLAGRQQRSGG